jgi:FkbM family methyltransferase
VSFIKNINYLITQNLKKAGIAELSSHFLFTPACTNGTFIDLGANKGDFYLAFQQKFKGSGYAIEASPALHESLPPCNQVQCFNYAITDKNGFIDFFISENSEANSLNATISEQWGLKQKVNVEGITLNEFIQRHRIKEKIDLVKIDIEGAEIPLLLSLSDDILHAIGQIAVEFHDFLIKDDEYKTNMNIILKKLKSLDFEIIQISLNDYREVLCINKKLISLSLANQFRIRNIHPFLKRIKQLHGKLHALKA